MWQKSITVSLFIYFLACKKQMEMFVKCMAPRGKVLLKCKIEMLYQPYHHLCRLKQGAQKQTFPDPVELLQDWCLWWPNPALQHTVLGPGPLVAVSPLRCRQQGVCLCSNGISTVWSGWKWILITLLCVHLAQVFGPLKHTMVTSRNRIWDEAVLMASVFL